MAVLNPAILLPTRKEVNFLAKAQDAFIKMVFNRTGTPDEFTPRAIASAITPQGELPARSFPAGVWVRNS